MIINYQDNRKDVTDIYIIKKTCNDNSLKEIWIPFETLIKLILNRTRKQNLNNKSQITNLKRKYLIGYIFATIFPHTFFSLCSKFRYLDRKRKNDWSQKGRTFENSFRKRNSEQLNFGGPWENLSTLWQYLSLQLS